MSGIYLYADIYAKLEKLRKTGLPRGPETGWDDITDLYRPEKRMISLVTGIPNHGKSAWLDALRVNLSCQYGWKHATFSPENYPLELYYANLVQIYAGSSIGMLPQEVWLEACHFIDRHFVFCYPNEKDCTVDGILDMFEACKHGFDVDSILIDPYNEIEHKRPQNMSETEYVSLFLTKIRRFAREKDVHAWLVAHPMKLQKDKNGDYPVPTPYDVSGSAHFRNKPDFCIAVHRPDFKEDYSEVHIQKVRFRNHGKVGMAELQYDWRSGRYGMRGTKTFSMPIGEC